MTETDSANTQSRHASRGELYAKDGTCVPVSISYNQDEVMLVILERAEEFFERSLLDLTLESTGGRGVYRTIGYGRRVDGNLIRFVADDPEEDVIQRREFVRVTTAQRVVLRDQDEKVLAVTLTVDLSGGGMLVKAPETLELGPQIYFDLYIGGSEEDVIFGTGKIVRTGSDGLRAVVFSEISHADRERLIKYIFDRQRLALAVTRGDAI